MEDYLTAKRTKLGEFNNLEGITNEEIRGKKFEVMRDSERNDKYVGKTIIVDRKYGYGYEKDKNGKEVYVGNIVWAHFEEQGIVDKNENITFYLRELAPREPIKI